MADNQLAGTGHRGQFWLDDATGTLTRLGQVVSFNLPQQLREFIETTHLDSNAKEYAPAIPDFDEFEVVLNFRPGSDTDLLLDAAEDDANPRDFAAHVPIRGVLTRTYTGSGYITYDRGEITVDGKMESTITVRMTGTLTSAAYVAP